MCMCVVCARARACVYVCGVYVYIYIEGGGIILLFYRVPEIEHASGLDQDVPRSCVVGPAKRWACIFIA